MGGACGMHVVKRNRNINIVTKTEVQADAEDRRG